MFNRKTALAASLLALGSLAAGTAQAGDVHWSVGINLPAVGTVISNAPVYHAPRPVYVEHAPAVVYRPAPPVVYHPAPAVVYRPVPVYAPGYYGPGVVRAGWNKPSHHHHRHHRHGHRHDRHDGHHDEYGDSHRGDRWKHEQRRQHH